MGYFGGLEFDVTELEEQLGYFGGLEFDDIEL